MPTIDYMVSDVHAWQMLLNLNVLGGATFSYTKGSAILSPGRGQDFETPCVHIHTRTYR